MKYLVELHKHFKDKGNTELAAGMSAYMKNRFTFLGIKQPKRKQLLAEFTKKHGLPNQETIDGVLIGLWSFPYREYHYCGVELFQKLIKKSDADKIHIIEYMLEYHQWWDTVDLISSNIVGVHFKNHPDLIPVYFNKWLQSDNFWLNRVMLLFQLKYKQETDKELLSQAILTLSDSSEFFIQKAIGWSLREYSKHNKDWVTHFVNTHKLAPLSVREASKYL
ncbi:DNA alkylation repair protein [Fulvivirga lutea]|uniref:DNA alkylation repair protein n=1 Tax=Fulvivirga lutea TaxID=2810512 RepID=A0A974WHA3_9BACT|nr:DNA alkylation repair protein [Fulvivirga lutea]QSE98356.1 DNA alkylation repair protein [Fulvivirga lutea]